MFTLITLITLSALVESSYRLKYYPDPPVIRTVHATSHSECFHCPSLLQDDVTSGSPERLYLYRPIVYGSVKRGLLITRYSTRTMCHSNIWGSVKMTVIKDAPSPMSPEELPREMLEKTLSSLTPDSVYMNRNYNKDKIYDCSWQQELTIQSHRLQVEGIESIWSLRDTLLYPVRNRTCIRTSSSLCQISPNSLIYYGESNERGSWKFSLVNTIDGVLLLNTNNDGRLRFLALDGHFSLQAAIPSCKDLSTSQTNMGPLLISDEGHLFYFALRNSKDIVLDFIRKNDSLCNLSTRNKRSSIRDYAPLQRLQVLEEMCGVLH